jgi:hypothetical protein
MAPNWAEQVTAVATAVGAVGLLAAIGAAVFGALQVREARHNRQTQLAADLLRRWEEDELVEARQLVAGFQTREDLARAFAGYRARNADEAFVLYRELDYFEQLGALDRLGALNFELVRLLLGQRLLDRWDLWQPSIDAMGPAGSVYPNFAELAAKMRRTLAA